MKTLTCLVLIGGLMVAGLTAPVQAATEVEQLQQQLQEMQKNFERMQQLQREQIEGLQKQLNALQQQPASNAPAPVAAEPAPTAIPGWQPSDPIRVGKGAAYMDMGLVATVAVGGSTASDVQELQLGGHDPNQRGFTVQGVEASFTGAVDPYFRGNANVLFGLDADGESYIELEEAWAETVSLPANLQVRGGQFMTDFGRVNTQHPHAWGFVDAPLANARFLGADGLRNPGARVSWLAPTPFYSELFLAVQNSQGETAAGFRSSGHSHGDEEEEEVPFGYRHADNDRGVHGVEDMLFTPRWASSFELTENQTVLAGVSAAFGPNSSGGSGDTRTEIYGADLTWKWKSPRAERGFPFVAWQSEVMLRKYDLGEFDWSGEPADGLLVLESDGVTPAVLGRETVNDWGFYSQMLWGFKPGWVAGLRFDYVGGDEASYESAGLIAQDADGNQEALGRDPQRDSRWRLSPNLTWYPSEFSKIRLQYNYDDRNDLGDDHSIWLQFEFLLGAHAAHKF
jgi:hypothetical protein